MTTLTTREISEAILESNSKHRIEKGKENVYLFGDIQDALLANGEKLNPTEISAAIRNAGQEYENRRKAAISLIGKQTMSPSRPGIASRPFTVLDVTDERDGSHNVRLSGGQYIPLWEFSEKWRAVDNAPEE